MKRVKIVELTGNIGEGIPDDIVVDAFMSWGKRQLDMGFVRHDYDVIIIHSDKQRVKTLKLRWHLKNVVVDSKYNDLTRMEIIKILNNSNVKFHKE